MKPNKTPEKLASNASALHKRIGELLISSIAFRGYQIRQEYRVSLVNPEFKSNREKFDWCILKLNVAIEVHGEQHYKPVRFGGISEEDAVEKFAKQQRADKAKQMAAKDAGWAHVIVSYEEKDITEEQLLEKIRTALAEAIISRTTKKLITMTKKPTIEEKKARNSIPPRKLVHGRTDYKWPSKKIPSRPFNSKRER